MFDEEKKYETPWTFLLQDHRLQKRDQLGKSRVEG